MEAGGQTNIWDGLFQAMESVHDSTKCKNPYILLFTDGLPNIVPPRGHLYMLEKYIDEKGLNA